MSIRYQIVDVGILCAVGNGITEFVVAENVAVVSAYGDKGSI